MTAEPEATSSTEPTLGTMTGQEIADALRSGARVDVRGRDSLNSCIEPWWSPAADPDWWETNARTHDVIARRATRELRADELRPGMLVEGASHRIDVVGRGIYTGNVLAFDTERECVVAAQPDAMVAIIDAPLPPPLTPPPVRKDER